MGGELTLFGQLIPAREEPLLIRPATDLDLPYVIRTWVLSSLTAPWLAARTHGDVESTLALPGRQVVVAAADECPDVICGFAVRRQASLHYLYVRRRLRRRAIASELLKALDGLEIHTCESADYRELLKAGVVRTRYQPEAR